MIHAERLTLHSMGFRGHRASLRSVGIFRDSPCWSKVLDLPSSAQTDSSYRKQHPHHILSPIHPSAWPFLVRVRISLEDKPGSLEKAANALAENGINVFTSEYAPAGYKHAVWSVIGFCTSESVASLASYPKEGNNNKINKSEAANIATCMYTFTNQLQKALLEVGKNESWICERQLIGESVFFQQVFKEEHDKYKNTVIQRIAKEFPEKDPGELIRKHIPFPVEATWLSRMAYYAACSSDRYCRFVCRGDLLEIDGGENIDFSGNSDTNSTLKYPISAIGSYHTRDKYVRIEPIESHTLQLLSVQYRTSKPVSRSAQGLLGRVISEVHDRTKSKDSNIVYHSHKIVRFNQTEERGDIRMAMELNGENSTNNMLSLSGEKLALDIEGKGKNYWANIEQIKIIPVRPEQLFISSKYRTGETSSKIVEIAEDIASKYGLTPVKHPDPTDPISSKIMELIEHSDAVLSIASIPPGTRRETDLAWLHHEYALAHAFRKPVIRLIDESSDIDWGKHLPVYRDLYNSTFDLRDRESSVKVISEAIKKIIERLNSSDKDDKPI